MYSFGIGFLFIYTAASLSMTNGLIIILKKTKLKFNLTNKLFILYEFLTFYSFLDYCFFFRNLKKESKVTNKPITLGKGF